MKHEKPDTIEILLFSINFLLYVQIWICFVFQALTSSHRTYKQWAQTTIVQAMSSNNLHHLYSEHPDCIICCQRELSRQNISADFGTSIIFFHNFELVIALKSGLGFRKQKTVSTKWRRKQFSVISVFRIVSSVGYLPKNCKIEPDIN